jgi:ABC-type iron transport system FetAB ATPase subunit
MAAAEEASRLELAGFRGANIGPIDLRLEGGECVSIGGPSGAGKSLLLRAIADLDPHEGTLRLDGHSFDQMSAPRWRRRVGLLPPETAWWANRVRAHFPTDSEPDLEALGLPDKALDWEITRLSSGERQRLGLLRLLVNRPSVLLLDEPTANLDPSGVERVEALVAGYRSREAAAVIWVSHDDRQRRRVGDRELRMSAGELHPLEAPEEASA